MTLRPRKNSGAYYGLCWCDGKPHTYDFTYCPKTGPVIKKDDES